MQKCSSNLQECLVVFLWLVQISYPWIHVSASILAWASAVINPIIYSVSSKSYRHAYSSLLGCKREATTYTRAATSATAKTTTSDMAVTGQ